MNPTHAPEQRAQVGYTPLPWRVEGFEIRGSDDIHTNGRIHTPLISSRSFSNTVCTIHGNPELPGPKANAALIVRAVNSHEALVEALKDILAAYHGLTLGRQDTEWEGQFKVKARDALALAEGGAS